MAFGQKKVEPGQIFMTNAGPAQCKLEGGFKVFTSILGLDTVLRIWLSGFEVCLVFSHCLVKEFQFLTHGGLSEQEIGNLGVYQQIDSDRVDDY